MEKIVEKQQVDSSGNMFKNAKFGDCFKTRDGRKAIYIYKETIYPFRHALSLGGVVNAMYKENGLYDMKEEVDNFHADIISEWQEPIDEEELDELAYRWAYNISGTYVKWELLQNAYKAGYRLQ